MSADSTIDYLERVKSEIRAEADRARVRTPLPRRDPIPAVERAVAADGIERERLTYSIAELSGRHYVGFLDDAYRALLKRWPDDASSATQARLLAAGASKAEILGNLRFSREGRAIGVRVHGLLPRYALAKLGRVPLLGYALNWCITLAGLPVLLRHQRSADTLVAARASATDDALHAQAARTLALEERIDAGTRGSDQCVQALNEQIRAVQSRLDVLEKHANSSDAAAPTHAAHLAGLRHDLNVMNHWMVALQRSLGSIEELAQVQCARADRLAVALGDRDDSAIAYDGRHRAWAEEWAAQLPAAAIVLDLGSGNGSWLDALRAQKIGVRGVERNAILVERAQRRGAQIALDYPLAALARCPDTSLDGISTTADLLGASDTVLVGFIAEAERALRVDGSVLLRLERDPSCLTGAPMLDAPRWIALLGAAGFVVSGKLAHSGVYALIARRA